MIKIYLNDELIAKIKSADRLNDYYFKLQSIHTQTLEITEDLEHNEVNIVTL